MDRVCDLLDFVSLRPRLTEVAAHHFPGSDLLVVPDPWYILFSASLRCKEYAFSDQESPRFTGSLLIVLS